MTQYTTTQAQQHLDELLEEASRSGSVEIRRSNGQTFVVTPIPSRTTESDLNVPPISTKATTKDILAAVRDSRETRH